MELLLEKLRDLSPKSLSFEKLGELVQEIDVANLSVDPHLPKIENSATYFRNILLMDPLECAVLHWPPGVESAIHWHEGFWGYVIVVRGEAENIEYTMQGGVLRESGVIKALGGGVLAEPDGVIHKICNASDTENLVTIHLYCPALESLKNMVIFDIETGTKAILNEKAQSASFREPEEHFLKKVAHAFKYVPFNKSKHAMSHRIYPIVPKPKPKAIKEMISSYYAEQAVLYDQFDLKHVSRRSYLDTINRLIAEDLQELAHCEKVLTLACGTGRRALNIRDLSERNYAITGVDLSKKMCEIATERGIKAFCADWVDADLAEKDFDVATFLYAFGHIPTKNERLLSLEKIHKHLKVGGVLYLDVFNCKDENEWGPKAIASYEKNNLGAYGYEKGDVFYKKMDGQKVAFLHYFSEQELIQLAEQVGFTVEVIRHIGYVYRSGEILDKEEQGALFVKLRK